MECHGLSWIVIILATHHHHDNGQGVEARRLEAHVGRRLGEGCHSLLLDCK